MDFFKPEDFKAATHGEYTDIVCSKIANAKLEKEGKIVYGSPNGSSHTFYPGIVWTTHDDGTKRDTHKAILINIESIKQLEQCKHPREKVLSVVVHLPNGPKDMGFTCQCGKSVKPSSFEEVK